jgi:Ca-activated chloride channel family protein
VFDGERLIAYGLAERITAGTATLSGTLAGRAVRFEMAIDPAQAIDGTLVATLAARARIRDLEEEQPYLEARASRQGRARSNRKAPDEIAALGVKYQLVSRETSFVAIERRETPAGERAELRRVPIALTRGWGGVRGRERPDQVCGYSAPSAVFMLAGGTGSGKTLLNQLRLSRSMAEPEFSDEFDGGQISFMRMPERAVPRTPRAAMRRATPTRAHDALVRLQRADGSWDLDEAFATAVGTRLATLEKALRGATGDGQAVRRALATAIAIAWLERHAADAQDEWQMLAEKGADWLRSCRATPAGGGDWLEIGRAMIA